MLSEQLTIQHMQGAPCCRRFPLQALEEVQDLNLLVAAIQLITHLRQHQ